MKLKKIYIQYCYGEKESTWTITYKRKRYGGVLKEGYVNYLSEKLANTIGLKAVHGSLEHIGSVKDLNNNLRYETYTLLVE